LAAAEIREDFISRRTQPRCLGLCSPLMAPFNTNQVKYIQAVAGRQQHTSLKPINENGVIKSGDFGAHLVPQTFDTSDPLLLAQFYLHEAPHCWDARGVHNNDVLESSDFTGLSDCTPGFGTSIGELRALDVPCVYETDGAAGDQDRPDDQWVPSTERATPDGFLKSLNLKLRRRCLPIYRFRIRNGLIFTISLLALMAQQI
jgi:hypothetical protein